MVIAVIFTYKRCGWCDMEFTNPDPLECGYCSIECRDNHQRGADMVVKRTGAGVYKCTLS